MGLRRDEQDQAFTLSQSATGHVFQERRHTKCMHDNVHRSIYVDALSLRFVDTEQFQRLRDVRQLGLCHMVYPGAVHTRFEHSLGTYYLADQAISRIKNFQGEELGIERSDLKVVKLAGLLHDIGHGPFSHVFDNEFLPKILPGEKWSHEQMSVDMIDYMVDLHHIDIDSSDVRRVQEMILASSVPVSRQSGREKRFLYDIVANGRNGIDVDKFDYIERDTRACGIGNGFNYARLMENMRVMEDEICYRAKEARNVYDLFVTRADLHRTVYTHPKVKAMELMVADAFLLADNYLLISDQIRSPEAFWKLDDTILKAIETADQQELQAARQLVLRLRRRQLYQFCNEYSVPREMLDHFKDVTPKDIVCAQTRSGVELKEEDICVVNQKIDLTRGQEDPVRSVSFFQDYESQEKFKIQRDRISHLLPGFFLDRIVRVYSKKPELVEIVSDAFENFQVKTYGVKTQVHGTPNGKKKKRTTSP
ncbi:hypothetical protein R1sor_005603 [Riccia sorocarpa]|uniref:HD/PDEase domain-containing protein n=1 Tax=Riccia sorocarpa TaxID=122646 RepID=A0ABD3HKB3_9MARC